MTIKRALDMKRKLTERVHSTFSSSISFKHDFYRILDELNKCVYDTDMYKHCPTWVRYYIHGVIDTMFDSITSCRNGHRALVHNVWEYNGQRVTDADKYSNTVMWNNMEWSEVRYIGTYWVDKDWQGNDKPYSTDELREHHARTRANRLNVSTDPTVEELDKELRS